MGKVLGSTVALFDPNEGRTVALIKGTVLPEWAEGLVHESRLVDSDDDVRAAIGEPADVDPGAVTVEIPDGDVPSKSIDDMTKDELLDEIAKLRADGVEIVVAPPGNKPELQDALRFYLEG